MARPISSRYVFYALCAITIAAIAYGIFSSSQKASHLAPLNLEEDSGPASPLSSPEPFFNFGKISMAAGNVSHVFDIRNSGSEPVTLTKLTTSCMCTTATLITRAGKIGPFGMPGHAPSGGVNERLAPGETARVEMVFDPAAHGPAGVGEIERSVMIRNSAGRPLELRFVALVTP